jgi:hypothetical protein
MIELQDIHGLESVEIGQKGFIVAIKGKCKAKDFKGLK